MEYEWMIKWGDLVDGEAIELHARNQLEPGNEIIGALQINDEWLMAYVDHGRNNNQDEEEWIPTPNEWQMLEEADPLDYVTLPLLFIHYEYESACDDKADRRLFEQPPENLEDFFGNVQLWEQEFVEVKHEWGVEPTEYQLIKKDDPLDTFSLSHLFGHETRLSLDENRAMNMFQKEYNSDPSKFIVPDTEPKPIVYIPEEPEVLFFESFEMENGHLMEGWAERETVEFLTEGEPIVDNEN
ncbi:hypothetical protein RHMOL_Rhmol03G0135900 [Rhododendron molle]|uniref:Uncharacterized protein n=1 Tax=Rhododendron molle TaxID=49168 RepID=A0ACC0PE70_RHOML|nr:hypothetical protein RHMOL_Rhmol03G0135900 [Rhododendron molle]